MHRAILAALLLLAAPAGAAESAAAASPVGGEWEGAIVVLGAELAIRVALVPSESGLVGTIDIPAQGALGLPLANARFEPPAVRFELPAGTGVATFDGELREGSIAGTFAQGGVSGTFRLARPAEAPVAETAKAESPSYREEEVRFETADGAFAATLSIPPGPGPHPAAILISGSGPQNRDEEVFGFRPFRVLADHLARSGVAVLRYDDRGVGGTTASPEGATTGDLARDALGAVAFLRGRPGIAPERIGLVGHSEGGIVAPLAAAREEGIAFLVLLSGMGVRGEQVLLDQGERIGRADGASDAEIARSAALQRRVFAAVRSGEGWETLRADLKKEAMADAAIEEQLAMTRSPWFRFFLDHDPAPALERVRCPVLALFGGLDLQVPAESNREAVAAALARGGNRNVTIRTFPGANHLYQAAKTGSPSEYAALPKEFVPGFLETISGWIREKTGLGPAPTGAGGTAASQALGAVPEPVPAPPPPAGSVEAEAEAFLRLLEKGDFEGAVARFGPDMKAAMGPAKLREAWSAQISHGGALRAVTGRSLGKGPDGMAIVDLACAFEKGRLTVRVVLDRGLKVAGLWFLPL